MEVKCKRETELNGPLHGCSMDEYMYVLGVFYEFARFINRAVQFINS